MGSDCSSPQVIPAAQEAGQKDLLCQGQLMTNGDDNGTLR
jgi:hypothetical protein